MLVDAGSDENDDGAVTDDGDGEDDDSDEGDEEDNHSDLESNEDQGSEDDGKTEKKPKRSAEEIKKELKVCSLAAHYGLPVWSSVTVVFSTGHSVSKCA